MLESPSTDGRGKNEPPINPSGYGARWSALTRNGSDSAYGLSDLVNRWGQIRYGDVVRFDGATAGPAAVRAAFALYVADAALSLLNAVLQLIDHLGGPLVLVGAATESVLFVSLGSRMRQGRQWARGALLGLAGFFIALGVLAFLALHSAFGSQTNGLVGVALVCVGLKVILIATATAMMYRPANTAFSH
jgi:hypothetical protein